MDQKPQAAPNTGHEGSGTEALELEQKPTGSEFYGEIVSVEETARRQKLEQRVKRKLDFIILPLLSTVYFLAQMVCPSCIVPYHWHHIQTNNGNRGVLTWEMRKLPEWKRS